jgi:tRNA nucleotidyltransferase (CCA-adding enzyme)
VRRDFSINAMALMLGGEHNGDLIDLHNGRLDLEHGLLRVLHEDSFTDDATRIFRGVRYEQRFGFVFEEMTKRLLFRDVVRVADISGDRVKHEFDRIMEEREPELALRRLGALGVLAVVVPDLMFESRQARAVARARTCGLSAEKLLEVMWCVLAWHLASEGCVGEFVTRLNLPRRLGGPVEDCQRLCAVAERLDDCSLAPSSVYALLNSSSLAALVSGSLLLDGATAREHASAYLSRFRHVRPLLNGETLGEMGFPAGPAIGRMLDRLRDARLDGLISTRAEELELAQHVLRRQSSG